jgi:hypothetical protein
MTVDARLERLYYQIELVRGSGDPKRRQLCIMSFVALLAGESHSDRPNTASNLIRRFAIVINDNMPAPLRQSLKSFAPRLIGTNDGHDPERINLLAEAVRREVLPRVITDFHLPVSASDSPAVIHGLSRKQTVELAALVATVTSLALPYRTSNNLASELAKLISLCALVAPDGQGEWYWLKAIDLFDRLCDVARERPHREIAPEWLSSLEASFRTEVDDRHLRARARSALARVCYLVPAFMR